MRTPAEAGPDSCQEGLGEREEVEREREKKERKEEKNEEEKAGKERRETLRPRPSSYKCPGGGG